MHMLTLLKKLLLILQHLVRAEQTHTLTPSLPLVRMRQALIKHYTRH